MSPHLCLSFSQTRQPVFVQLLQGVFRVYHCNWLMPSQKASVESCIRVLSDVGKTPTQFGFNMMKMRWSPLIKAILDQTLAVALERFCTQDAAEPDWS